MQSNCTQCTPYFIKKCQIKILDRSFAIVFYCNNPALTAIDDVTIATDDVIHMMSHHNTSCYRI